MPFHQIFDILIITEFVYICFFATPWTVTLQLIVKATILAWRIAVQFSRQEYWNRLPFPYPGDLPDPGIEPRSPALQADSLLSEPPEHRLFCVPDTILGIL